MQVIASIRNLPEIKAAIRKYPSILVPEMSRRLLRAGFLVERHAKIPTPVDTGTLRRSIGVSQPTGSLQARQGLLVEIAPHTEYAHWIHEGWAFRGGKKVYIRGRRKTPPGGIPFLKIGLEKSMDQIQREIGLGLKVALEKATKEF